MAAALNGGQRRNVLRQWWPFATHRGLYHDSHDELTRPRDDALSLIPFAAISAALVAMPSLSEAIVNRTVNNYSLPETDVETMERLSDDLLENCFAKMTGHETAPLGCSSVDVSPLP